ncbi:hypothetical protein FPV67DRAFT_1478571 [Lyophyllum atratum]|nr:hypothetical protein FPV67DRAFT_1478571 [Lyophyllum atratum]
MQIEIDVDDLDNFSMQEAQDKWYENVYLPTILNACSISSNLDDPSTPSYRPSTPPTIPIIMSNTSTFNPDFRLIRKERNGRYTMLDNEGVPLRSLEAAQLRSFLHFDAAIRVGKRPLVPVGFRTFRDSFDHEPIAEQRLVRWTGGHWEVPATSAPSYIDLAVPLERHDEEALRQMKVIIDLEDKVEALEAQQRTEGRNKQRQQEAINERRARKRLGLAAAPRGRGGHNHDGHRSRPFHAREDSPVRSTRAHGSRPYSPPRMSSPTPRTRRYPSYDRSRSRTRSRSLTPTQYQDGDMNVDIQDAEHGNMNDMDLNMQLAQSDPSHVAAAIAEAFHAAGGTQATASGAPSTSGTGAFPPVGVATAAQYPKITKSRAASPKDDADVPNADVGSSIEQPAE